MQHEKIVEEFRNIPTIETERLILRRILPQDYSDMYEYSRSSSVTKYLLWDKHPSLGYTKEYVEFLQGKYESGDYYDWALVLKSSGKMIGTCGFTSFDTDNNTAEIGYVLNEKYHHMGYATEATTAVIGFGFNHLKLSALYAKYMSKNYASRRVMDRCNMHEVNIQKHALFCKRRFRDIVTCRILCTEYYHNC